MNETIKETIKDLFVREGLIPFGYNDAKKEEATTVYVYASLFKSVLKQTLEKTDARDRTDAIHELLEEIYTNFPDLKEV